MNTNVTYYQVLGISESATTLEINKAYKTKAAKCHPDKASQNNMTVEKANETFKQVLEAYETLSNPQKRIAYDLKRSISHTPFSTSFSSMRAHHFQAKTEVNFELPLYPVKINQELNRIIEDDSTDALLHYLENNSFNDSLLKTILYSACSKGKINNVKYLIEIRKLSPHLKVNNGLPFTGAIFKAAAESGNLELVRYLLEVHQVDIESQGLTEGTQHSALSKAAKKGHVDVVEYLISKGANLNPRVSYSDILYGSIRSKKLSVVKLLVEAGTKIGSFALEKALEGGSLEIVQYLLEKKPNMKAHSYTESPACKAVRSGNVALVKYLEEKEGLDLFEKEHSWHDGIALLLAAAAESKSVEMMQFLLDERGFKEKVTDNPKYIQSTLSKAVELRSLFSNPNDDLKFVRFLMEERKFILTPEKLKNIIVDNARSSGIEMNSYLQSYLHDSDQEKKDILLTIANQGLKALSLADLFKLYHSRLIEKGKCSDFSNEVHLHIKEHKISIEYLREYLLENKQVIADAFLYYSSYHYKKDPSYLKLLLEIQQHNF